MVSKGSVLPKFAALAGLYATLACACDTEPSNHRQLRAASQQDAGRRDTSSPPSVSKQPGASQPLEAEFLESQRATQRALEIPGLPVPSFEAKRASVLAQAKAEPAFFVRTPEFADANTLGAVGQAVRHYRYRLHSTSFPWTVLSQLLPHFAAHPTQGRATLLREGYLYSEDPKLAYALVNLVGPEHLFTQHRIWVQRGARVMNAEREKSGRYRYVSGRYYGQFVRLLHLDRIGPGERPSEPALHRDFRSLRYALGFERARVRHITEQRLVVDLRYGSQLWIPTQLGSSGPRLELETELIAPEQQERVRRLRKAALSRQASVQALRAAILKQVEEGLPFDEPRTEVGQQDGILRRSWRRVYAQGRSSYDVNLQSYPVFDELGRPLVPQVCVDFILDSFERASGRWFLPRGQAPGQSPGQLDFAQLMPRFELRRAHRFVELARSQSDWFQVLDIPPSERIALGHKRRFFADLAERADDFQSGDVVFIRGKTPWDNRKEHTHAFFVFETDPLTGVPIAIVGNASRPEIWSWGSEARRTPLRSVRHRLRPQKGLLRLLNVDAQILGPPPLVPGHAHEARRSDNDKKS